MAIDESALLDKPWARTLPARGARELLICGVFGVIIDSYARREILGRKYLTELPGPAIFVANHCSHVDTPLLLRSLNARARRRTAVLAAADYFYRRRLLGGAVSLAFCTVPLERRGGGFVTGAAPHIQKLIDGGWNLIVFAEGTRSRDGSVGRLRAGAALLAAEHGLPIVPVHISGTHQMMPPGRGWPVRPDGPGRHARHSVHVSFGRAIHVNPGDDRFEVMELVRLFMDACGADTTPDRKLAARRTAAVLRAARSSPATPSQPV